MIAELAMIMGQKNRISFFWALLVSGLSLCLSTSCVEEECTDGYADDYQLIGSTWMLSSSSYVIADGIKMTHEAYMQSNIDSTIISVLDGIVEFHEDSTFSSGKTFGTYFSSNRKLTLRCNYGGKIFTFAKGADVAELLNPPPYENEEKGLDEQSDSIPPSYTINSLAFRFIDGQLFLNLIATLEVDMNLWVIEAHRNELLREVMDEDEVNKHIASWRRITVRTIESHNIYDKVHY